MSHRIASILAAAVSLSLGASAAFAGVGLNLAWNACAGDGGARNMDFACNSNTPVFTLVGSFSVPGSGVPMMSFIIARIEVSAQNSGTLSWWSSFGSGACRPSALTVSTSIPPAAVSCADTWAGAVTTTFTGGYVPDGPYSEGIGIIVALPDGQTEALVPGVEYFAFNLLINSGLTVGPGACSGCDVPACVAWRGMEIQQPPNPGGPTVYLAGGGEYLVTWQSASLTSYGCRLATPALNRTWGAVKSLYR